MIKFIVVMFDCRDGLFRRANECCFAGPYFIPIWMNSKDASIRYIPPERFGRACANEDAKSEIMDVHLGSCFLRAAWYFRKHLVLFKIFFGDTSQSSNLLGFVVGILVTIGGLYVLAREKARADEVEA